MEAGGFPSRGFRHKVGLIGERNFRAAPTVLGPVCRPPLQVKGRATCIVFFGHLWQMPDYTWFTVSGERPVWWIPNLQVDIMTIFILENDRVFDLK